MCTITVPVKPYLLKYLRKKLNFHNDQFLLTNEDPIGFGIFINALLLRKRAAYVLTKKDQMESFMSKLNISSCISITLPPTNFRNYGMYISDENVFNINQFIDKAFRNEMMTFLFGQKLLSPNVIVTYSVSDFLAMFDITENELKMDTVLKNYQRHKSNYSYLE